MISVVICFAIILITSYMVGRAGMQLLGFVSQDDRQHELCVVFGLAVICLYAQIFSLFAGVSLSAFVGLIILTLVSALYLKKCGFDLSNIVSDIKKIKKGQWIICLIILIAVVLWTDLSPQHYDTYLYHAQAIHWIEEYGAVKGLGNLHFRLAYNSELMPLQALYSLAWLGNSLHCLNGFFTGFILIYSALSIMRGDGVHTSDVMKLGMMLYILYDSFHMSSPNTDTMALLLIYFIIIKWQEYMEEGISGYKEYGLLCIFVVFATTIKLSVGIMVLFVIYPACIMIRKKANLAIIKHILVGTVMIIPYLIRNVIISGYVIYPYEITGIKSLDWLMPVSVLKGDREEIIAWGRGNMDVSRNAEPIWKWFGQWYGSINILWKVLLVLTAISIVLIAVLLIKKGKKIQMTEVNLLLVCISGMIFWLMTAPLPRYGTIYMITLPCIAAGMLLQAVSFDGSPLMSKTVRCAWVVSLAVYLLLFGGYIFTKNITNIPVLIQGDYNNHETEFEVVGDYKIAVPLKGDQTGYLPFPSAPYGNVDSRIELRGDSLKDGFRSKSKK